MIDTLCTADVPQEAGASVYVLMAAGLIWRPAGLFARG